MCLRCVCMSVTINSCTIYACCKALFPPLAINPYLHSFLPTPLSISCPPPLFPFYSFHCIILDHFLLPSPIPQELSPSLRLCPFSPFLLLPLLFSFFSPFSHVMSITVGRKCIHTRTLGLITIVLPGIRLWLFFPFLVFLFFSCKTFQDEIKVHTLWP